jgi:hypothetical protein
MTDPQRPPRPEIETPPEFAEHHGYHPSLYRPPEYLEYLEKATVAIRTVRIVVYAGMASFVLLAIYGFYLIYQLTTDLERAVDQTVLMTQQMQAMTRVMTNMDTSMSRLDESVTAMKGNVATMSRDMTQLGSTVALMQHSAANLDRSIGPTMGTMNRMLPFNWMGSNYGGAPPYAPPFPR